MAVYHSVALLLAFAGPTSWLRVEAKSQTGSQKFGPRKENRWKYLSKFAYGVGQGHWQFRFQATRSGGGRLPESPPTESKARLELFLDEEWPKAEAAEDECSRKDFTRSTREVHAVWGATRLDEWSQWFNGTVKQSIRPHVWFFALSMCDSDQFSSEEEYNMTIRVRFEFRASQPDLSEFSIEMRRVPTMNALNLAVLTVFFVVVSRRCYFICQSAGEVHPVIWTLIIAASTQYLAQAVHALHIWSYSENGKGTPGLELLSEILDMLSQVLLTSLLILIALGYTLLQSRIGDLDIVIPLCFMVAMIHIMLVGFSKIQDDASYKFHKNEGICGWLLVCLRLLLFAWFLWSVQATANTAGMKLRSFLMKFRFAGALYFLAFPAIFLIGRQFAPYLQQPIMTAGLMIMQMASNIWLASLFLLRGDYFQVSTLNSSFLPGGARVGLDKEE